MRGSKKFDRKNWIGLILTTLFATVIALVMMRVWEMDLNVPVSFSGDGALGGSCVRVSSSNSNVRRMHNVTSEK